MRTIRVPGVPQSSYRVLSRSLEEAFADRSEGDALVTDAHLASLYPSVLERMGNTVVVPAGELSKSAGQFAAVIESLAAQGLKRSGRIFAFGGGVVGDLAGFAAATYARGVGYVQVPTSLLAMVDSSVGGKTGIDLGGKNMTGAFHFPLEVRVCLETLQTLPPVEFTNGMAEVCKYGFILSEPLTKRLSKARVMADDDELGGLIETCIGLKQSVVETDPYEQTGHRAVLNFGHTVGHALEELSGFTLKHGFAVSIGMVAECAIATQLGIANEGLTDYVAGVLNVQGLPTRPVDVPNLDDLLATALKDKKTGNQGIACSLVSMVGECKLHRDIPVDVVRKALAELWH